MAQPRACCFEAVFLNTTLTTHLLSMVHARLNAAKLPRRSACSSKHRFFFIPVLRSVQLFLCKNRFKIWLAQEPPAAANDAHFFPLPQMGLGSALSVGIFLADRVVSGSPKSPPIHANTAQGVWGFGINRTIGQDEVGDSWKKNEVLLPENSGKEKNHMVTV